VSTSKTRSCPSVKKPAIPIRRRTIPRREANGFTSEDIKGGRGKRELRLILKHFKSSSSDGIEKYAEMTNNQMPKVQHKKTIGIDIFSSADETPYPPVDVSYSFPRSSGEVHCCLSFLFLFHKKCLLFCK
jgi:hypothetical protein